MILYHRFHVDKVVGSNATIVWLEECERWLKEHLSADTRRLSGTQFPQTNKSAENMVSLTMMYQAHYQDGLEKHYDIDLHSVYVSSFTQVVSEKWSYWRIAPDINHAPHLYILFNIPDELAALQFKLANL